MGILGGIGRWLAFGFKNNNRFNVSHKDQDHIQVVCFTNPKIPDRTNSLLKDGGKDYVKEVSKSLKVLAEAGANFLAIPCNTAHAGLNKFKLISRFLY